MTVDLGALMVRSNCGHGDGIGLLRTAEGRVASVNHRLMNPRAEPGRYCEKAKRVIQSPDYHKGPSRGGHGFNRGSRDDGSLAVRRQLRSHQVFPLKVPQVSPTYKKIPLQAHATMRRSSESRDNMWNVGCAWKNSSRKGSHARRTRG